LTLRAHRKFLSRVSLKVGWNSRCWHRTWICKCGFDVTRQCQSYEYCVNIRKVRRNSTCLRQKCNSQARIAQKYPYHNTHYGSCIIISIQPYSIFIACSHTALPGKIVKVISVVATVRPFVTPRPVCWRAKVTKTRNTPRNR